MTTNETQKPERNPKAQKDHKRETFWQITFPLILGVIFVLILATLTFLAATGDGRIAQAADAALIFLIIPLMLFTLISTIIFAAITFGMIKLNSTLPFYFKQLQDVLVRVRQQVQMGSDKSVEPILKIQSFFASLKALKRK
jgi:heme/copper-type cytochrome/quinol oxidase subunit 2